MTMLFKNNDGTSLNCIYYQRPDTARPLTPIPLFELNDRKCHFRMFMIIFRP